MKTGLLFILILFPAAPVSADWFQAPRDESTQGRSLEQALKRSSQGVNVKDLRAHLAKTQNAPPAPVKNDAFVFKRADQGSKGSVEVTLSPQDVKVLFSKGGLELTAFPARTRQLNKFNVTFFRSTDPDLDIEASRAPAFWMTHDATKKLPDIDLFVRVNDVPQFGGVKVIVRSNVVDPAEGKPLTIRFSDFSTEPMGSVQIRPVEFPGLRSEPINPGSGVQLLAATNDTRQLDLMLTPANAAALLKPGFLEFEVKLSQPRVIIGQDGFILNFARGPETLYTFHAKPAEGPKWGFEDLARQSPAHLLSQIQMKETPDRKTLLIRLPSSILGPPTGKDLTLGFRNSPNRAAGEVSIRGFTPSPQFQPLSAPQRNNLASAVERLASDNFFVRVDAMQLLKDVFRLRMSQAFPADHALVESAQLLSQGPLGDEEFKIRAASLFKDFQARGQFQDYSLGDPSRGFLEISREILPLIAPKLVR